MSDATTNVTQLFGSAPAAILATLELPRLGVIASPPGLGKTFLAVKLAIRSSSEVKDELVVASGQLVEWLRPRVEPGIEVKTWGN